MAGECDGVVGNGDEKCLCNEGDLGPKDLQHGSSPITLLEGYRRLGRLKPAEFLATWRTLVVENGKSQTRWKWPNASQEGFLLNQHGQPIAGTTMLGVGTLIDRFGHEDTTYFAPFATPYSMRSLPPSSLNDDYAVYAVKKSIAVVAGPIAPGFEQPGLGTQYIFRMKPGDLFDGSWLTKLSADEVLHLYNSA